MKNETRTPEEISAAATYKVDMTKEEILEKLSPASRATLQKVKTHSPLVGRDEWMNFLGDLKSIGAISQQEYFLSKPGTLVIPLVSHDGGKTYRVASMPEEIHRAMENNLFWPCDPLKQLDTQISLLNDWFHYLTNEMEKCEEPSNNYTKPVREQTDACSQVSSLVKSLIS